jgi:hypothetical protein
MDCFQDAGSQHAFWLSYFLMKDMTIILKQMELFLLLLCKFQVEYADKSALKYYIGFSSHSKEFKMAF